MEFPQKKKADIEALQSAFMKVPKMNVATARDLLDLGFSQPYQLIGRSPEALFEDLCRKKQDTPKDRLIYIQYLIYYVENPDQDFSKITPYSLALKRNG